MMKEDLGVSNAQAWGCAHASPSSSTIISSSLVPLYFYRFMHYVLFLERLMVQGGLLTAHPGSVHGYGWSPGGGVSFRQGAGAASLGSPDLETAAAAEQRGFCEKGICIRCFYTEG